ncbi:N-acetylmuramoyl-L-alanine amidase [Erythrobacteraceae bacterium CFH 75059]|uniref:N-acetylmuramoyl-L-alanine amidase family protein n=1 Tax=Qipengyuania thermophila TaxID=2509361 RepID=UPI00102154A9|nr:N-acetylmuramoyl-L-alanine amidase [Qipengyuania thermophila]TCD05312.1 N-acetylmuramoyl-L-alanine amidase [Erythrobacteraceae bacterium CFH 75059]
MRGSQTGSARGRWWLAAGLAALLAVVAVFTMAGAGQGAPVQRVLLQRGLSAETTTVFGPPDPSLPLVVIDPGHGGFDPGASAPDGRSEKDAVLAIALALRDELVARGGIRVALTRTDDRFISLRERPALARRLGADLFLSLHADSGGAEANALGASVYTFAPRASSSEAARFGERENNSGLPGDNGAGDAAPAVQDILADLTRRGTRADAAEFKRLLVRESAGELTFRQPPTRSAALIVLAAPDVPSALFEVGFITNAGEAARLHSPEGQAQIARVTASAIRAYLARRDRS